MSQDMRGIVYPLKAVHQREGWALDALQAGMALATRRAADAATACDQLQQSHVRAAAASTPDAKAAIDPQAAQARLLYLADLQHRLQRAGETHAALGRERERAREAVRLQQVKLEALECHRDAFLRAEAATQERLGAVEADRDWLARSQWHRAFRTEQGTTQSDAMSRRSSQ